MLVANERVSSRNAIIVCLTACKKYLSVLPLKAHVGKIFIPMSSLQNRKNIFVKLITPSEI